MVIQGMFIANTMGRMFAHFQYYLVKF